MGDFKGIEGYRQFLDIYFTAFPDIHMTIEDEVGEGDKVVQRATVHGTHKGNLMGIPPTGKQITMAFMSIVRYADGKWVESRALADLLGMMQQLGIVPTQ
jgi:predicted ester cyclase